MVKTPRHLALSGIAQALLVRLRQRVSRQGTCLIYTGYLRNGYGCIQHLGRNYYVHRLSWVLRHGEIPEGLNVLHRCDVPACLRRSHLFLGTQADNVADMHTKGRDRKRALQGEAHPQARLTDKEVAEIRVLINAGAKQRDVAATFGCSQSTAWRIANGLQRRERHNT
jgi:hypothetical protein